MLELIKHGTKINFTSAFHTTAIISFILSVGSLLLIIFKGFNYGVDFRGGAEIQVKFNQSVDLELLRDSLNKEGFHGAAVQSIGESKENEYLIKVLADEKNLNPVTQKISASLEKNFHSKGVEIRKTDIVGPKAGTELRTSAAKAMVYSIIAILIYIGLRFNFKYAPGAVIALIHDASIVMGVWVIFDIEFTLQTVAAILTIIGYSVNDTVVIYDRVREHEDKNPGKPLLSVLNIAVNETLSRTILTAGATLLSALAMYIWGGKSIKDFFLAMSIGIVVGTYSSIFIAASCTLVLDKYKDRFSFGQNNNSGNSSSSGNGASKSSSAYSV